MKKKIYALIMIIPIVFLVTVFSVGKVAGIYADVPVTGIRIVTQSEDGIISVDVAEYEKPIELVAQVEPESAKNQNYKFEISGVDDEEAPDGFEIIDGKLIITDVGKAKITAVSAEKGFRDSIIVDATSSKVLRINPVVVVGEEKIETRSITMNGGEVKTISANLYPANKASSSIKVEECGEKKLLKIDPVTGETKALFSGKTQVRITCPNDGIKNLEEIVDVDVKVENLETTGFAINGKSNDASINLYNNAKTLKVYVESYGDELKESDITLPSGASVQEIKPLADKQFIVSISLPQDDSLKNCEATCKIGGAEFKVSFTDYTLDIKTSYFKGGKDEIKQINKSVIDYVAYSEHEDDDVKFFFVIEKIENGDDVISIEQDGRNAKITARKRGKARIRVVAKQGDEEITAVFKYIIVVPEIKSFVFADSAKEYGIEKILTIGDKKPNTMPDERIFSLQIKTENDSESPDAFADFTKIDFSNSADNLKTKDTNDGTKYTVKGISKTGITTLTAQMTEYNSYFGTNICAKIRFRAVKDGRNVGNYEELKRVTEDGGIVVLTGDVMLGVKKDGTAMTEDELKKDVKKFTTTYDKTYLENSGESKEVQYLIEFKNHVYGNGFEINADKFTQCKDATGVPKIFKGPLNFVAISSASVKGQDNISFLVRTDKVLINNVVLKGCSDDSLLEEDGQFNLSKLNYVGTTLEIAKSAKLLNSRVSNGRTVVRIFAGGSTMGSPVVKDESAFNVQDEKINVHIESCVLSNAREFILKIGSNRALKQTESKEQRKLRKEKDNEYYSPYDESNKTDKYFNDNYLINDVTLKNSVLETSGLFSVGMETHFSGEFLLGGKIPNWEGCAATSYASALRIVGDVKMLDWKNLSNVDSSTLIEVTGDANPLLSMNVAAMMEEVANVNKAYSDIILNVGGTKYVHGGIAFYGGGYNYSYLDLTRANDETKQFGVYNVNIDVLADSEDEKIKQQGEMLPMAAGAGDFRFYLYNNKSSRNLSWQESIKNQGNQGENIIPVVAEDVK